MADNLDPRRVIHANLLQHISDNFDTNSAEYENFLHQMGSLSSAIGRGVLQQKKTLYAKFDALENQGLLGIDKYDFLKNIAKNSKNIWMLEHIERAERALEEEKEEARRIQEEADVLLLRKCTNEAIRILEGGTKEAMRIPEEPEELLRRTRELEAILEDGLLWRKRAKVAKLEDGLLWRKRAKVAKLEDGLLWRKRAKVAKLEEPEEQLRRKRALEAILEEPDKLLWSLSHYEKFAIYLEEAKKKINSTKSLIEDTIPWTAQRTPRHLSLSEAFEGMDLDAAFSKWIHAFNDRNSTDDGSIIQPTLKQFIVAIQTMCKEATYMVQYGSNGAQLFARVKEVNRFLADFVVADSVKAGLGSHDRQGLQDKVNAMVRDIEELVQTAQTARAFQLDRASSPSACSRPCRILVV